MTFAVDRALQIKNQFTSLCQLWVKLMVLKNGTNNIKADISMKGPKVRGKDQFQIPGSNSVQGRHLLSRNLHQDCPSNGSNGQIKEDMAVQYH